MVGLFGSMIEDWHQVFSWIELIVCFGHPLVVRVPPFYTASASKTSYSKDATTEDLHIVENRKLRFSFRFKLHDMIISVLYVTINHQSLCICCMIHRKGKLMRKQPKVSPQTRKKILFHAWYSAWRELDKPLALSLCPVYNI